MNRTRILIVFLLLSVRGFAQFSGFNMVNVDGLSVGLEKNNSVWADYAFKNGFHINIKHTAIADELSRQSWRISALYGMDLKVVQAVATPFVTSDWKTSFYNFGLSLKFRNLWKDKIVKFGVEYIPYYDKELRFQNGWAVGTQVRLYKQVSCFTEYGRNPDYRIAYERMYLGFVIEAKDLCVKPMLELPSYDSGIRWTHSKIVVSLYYNFRHFKK